MLELEQERQIAPLPPIVIGGSVVVPIGLLRRLQLALNQTGTTTDAAESAESRKKVELLAMQLVMEAETRLGFEPRDVSDDKCGYDIESRIPGTGKLRFIEVKGRVVGATTVTVTRNEILTALNKPDDFILAIGQMEDGHQRLTYIRQPFQGEPEFAVESINYKIHELLLRGELPA